MSETKKHSHRCQDCGAIWSHGELLQADIEAHTCPKCQKPGQWRKYNGLQMMRKAVPADNHSAYFGGASRIILALTCIVIAGCLFAHVIVGFIEGDYRG